MSERGLHALVAVVMLAAALALAVTHASAKEGLRDCGDAVKDGAGSYDIRASAGVGCKQARRVARKFYPGGEDHYKSWRCKGTQIDVELGKATCHRGKKPNRDTVKFTYGA